MMGNLRFLPSNAMGGSTSRTFGLFGHPPEVTFSRPRVVVGKLGTATVSPKELIAYVDHKLRGPVPESRLVLAGTRHLRPNLRPPPFLSRRRPKHLVI
jgi:hypothetical protein